MNTSSGSFRKDRNVSEPQQQALWIEDWRDGIVAIGQALGKRKDLALRLRPAKGERAAGWLSDCLNPERQDKLDTEDFIEILRIGRQYGCHVLMAYLCETCGYAPPVPVTPEDQAGEVVRSLVESAAQHRRDVDRLEALIAHNPELLHLVRSVGK